LLCLYNQANDDQVKSHYSRELCRGYFPEGINGKLRISKGDTLYVLETPNGFELTPYDPDFVQQMEAAEAVMREDRNVLRSLAN